MSLSKPQPYELESTPLESSVPESYSNTADGRLGESNEIVFALSTPRALQAHLEDFGYQIPILKVERARVPLDWSEDEFNLPLSNRDLYEDMDYEEFSQILNRMDPRNPKREYFRFKLDFEAIWEGLTGSPMAL